MYSREIYDEVRATYGHLYIYKILLIFDRASFAASHFMLGIYRADISGVCTSWRVATTATRRQLGHSISTRWIDHHREFSSTLAG